MVIRKDSPNRNKAFQYSESKNDCFEGSSQTLHNKNERTNDGIPQIKNFFNLTSIHLSKQSCKANDKGTNYHLRYPARKT